MNSLKVVITIIVLLGIIIGSSVFALKEISAKAQKIEEINLSIQDSIKDSDWAGAKYKLTQLEGRWKQSKKPWTMLIDHVEIDNIDISIEKLKKEIEIKNTSLATVDSAILGHFIKRIPDKESVSFKNVL